MSELSGLRRKINAVTVDMSACAAENDWAGAAELSELRRDLLEALFAMTTDPAEEVALIERILESDRCMKALAVENRRDVADELAERRKRRRIAGLYRDAASAEI